MEEQEQLQRAEASDPMAFEQFLVVKASLAIPIELLSVYLQYR